MARALARSFAAAYDEAVIRTAQRFLDPIWAIKRRLRVGSERELYRALSEVRRMTLIAPHRLVVVTLRCT